MPRLIDRPQAGGVRGERGLQRLGQVLQEVEAVHHLHGFGRATPDPVGVGARAISGDHGDTRVIAQPCRQGVCLAVGQQSYRPSSLQVDEHGAIGMAPAQGPVVDPEDRRRDLRRQGSRPDQPQQRVARGRQAQLVAQPGAGRTAQREADRGQPCGEARRPA
jgi:hypothetical protein